MSWSWADYEKRYGPRRKPQLSAREILDKFMAEARENPLPISEPELVPTAGN